MEYGESLQHHLWNMVEQCDGMSMQGFQWYWVTGVYQWRDRRQPRFSQMQQSLLIEMNNDPKHTAKTTQEFLKVIVEKWNIVQWLNQSPDFNPIEHAFPLLKTKLKAERPTNKQQLKSAAVKAWQSITKEETQSLVMYMNSRFKAVIACKGFSTNYYKWTFYLWLYLFVQLHLSPWKWGDCV